MKKWKSKNPDWPVQEGTTAEIVDSFLDIHKWWFLTPENNLFRQRPNCRRALIQAVETGDFEPPPYRIRHEICYVLAKFHTEYFRSYGLVENP